MTNKRDDEIALREAARATRGKVVAGSGTAIEPRKLDQMVSLRLDPEILADLRKLANQAGTGVSELLRTAASQFIAASRLHSVVVEVTDCRGALSESEWSRGVITFTSITDAGEADQTRFSHDFVDQC
jgi:hypothetical protein